LWCPEIKPGSCAYQAKWSTTKVYAQPHICLVLFEFSLRVKNQYSLLLLEARKRVIFDICHVFASGISVVLSCSQFFTSIMKTFYVIVSKKLSTCNSPYIQSFTKWSPITC
jgi:hypothetical protein